MDKNKLIILGNGFDLACGQPTRLDDFTEPKINSNRRYYFDEHLFELDFLSYLYHKCSIDSGGELLKFLKVNQANDWKDFELILNHVLFDESIFNQLDALRNKLSYRPLNENSDYFSEIVIYYFRNCHERLYSKRDYSFLDFLESQVDRFESEFKDFLNNSENNEQILSKKKLLFKEIQCETNAIVLNFNYTSLGVTTNEVDKIIHVHGTIKDNNIVIGVDPTSNSQFKNCLNLYEKLGDKIKFTKTYKRLKNVYSNQDFILTPDIDIVSFYGHSLGEQDYSYFQSIFDRYSLYDGKLILEFCYSEYNGSDEHYEYNRLISRIAKLINKYGETLENKDHGKNLLNKLMLEGRIKIRKIDTNKLFEI